MFLGIDLGTSEVKLLLLDAHHRIVATAGEPLTVQRPHPLWSEQHPDQWWAATHAAMARLALDHADALKQVRAIGLSGQMHGAVLLNAQRQVLRPAILWNDGRSAAECAEMEAQCPRLHALAGNLAMPGFTAPKLQWVRKHEPALFMQTKLVLLPKDWLRLQLTGEAVSEMSDASGTLWLDVGQRRWSHELLDLTGLNQSHMPRLVEGSEPSGVLKPELARQWGLPDGVVVAGGGGDNAASAVGMGAVQPNQGFVSLGTSGVIFLSSDRFRPNPASALHAFCHALPGTWHQMSVMLSAASALRWVRELMGLASEAELMARIATLTPAQRATAPLFLPYLSGERSPHNNPNAQGVLFGLNASHDAAAVGYAVMEGVSFGLRDGWDSLDAAPGSVAALSLVGGGARSSLWAQQLASLIGVPMHTHTGGEAGGALGAARLGWLAVGGAVSEVCTRPPVAAVFEPQADQLAEMAPRRARWQKLYPLLDDGFWQAP
jgi:xylulokinase